MSEPGDDELFAFVLEGLPPARAAELEAWSTSNAERATRLAKVRALVAALETKTPTEDLVAGVDTQLAARSRRRARSFIAASGVTLAALVAIGVVWWSAPREPSGDGLRVKGSSPRSWAGVRITRLDSDGVAHPLEQRLASTDRLAFAYTNGGPTPFSHLLIFAVASTGQVFWYFPAWLDGREDPKAIAIKPSTQPIDLEEQIGHELPVGPLEIDAVFLDRPLSVTQLEQLVLDGGLGRPLPVPSALQQRFTVEVF